MTEFRKSYLAPEAEPWVRELEQRVIALEKRLQIAEQNNAAADAQLRTSYNRLDLAYSNLEELLLNTIDTVEYLESTQADVLELDSGNTWTGMTTGIEDVFTYLWTTDVGAGGRKVILIATVNVYFENFIDIGATSGAGQELYLEIGNGTTYALFTSEFGHAIDVTDSEGNTEAFTSHRGSMVTVAEYDLAEGSHSIPINFKREGWDGNSPDVVQGGYTEMRLLILPGPNENIAEETLATTKIARK